MTPNEAERAELATAIAIDRAYIAGARMGYNYGTDENKSGLTAALSIRRTEISQATRILARPGD